ncbi:transglycosylase domain-containing protein [Synergistes jonesii]|uniref:transglycosylase domain-containing protein n=1 Tax=Synergistes jonesii TaxID=2754 RepID=UPI0024325D7F|nr:PBP1A family penicillin-binding protein [Synergistes jonesii]
MSSTARQDTDFSIEHKPKKRPFILSFFSSLLLLAVLLCAAGAVAMIFFLKDVTSSLPSYQDMLDHQPSLATTLYDRNGKVITQLFQENRTWVKLDAVSPWMVKAILAAEDSSFYEHSGIRPVAVIRAGLVDIFHRGAKQGASTITQQLARNLFLSSEKTIIRKAKEAVLALRLERIYTKDQLLEMYLNTIYMGHGAYGIEAAAKTYFGKQPKELGIDESAVLAGLVAAPEKYSPFRHAKNSHVRKAYVMRRMLDLDWISNEDYKRLIDKKPALVKRRNRETSSLSLDGAPYFVSYILFNQLLPVYGTDKIYRGGLKIHTTIDLDIQRKAEEIVSKMPHEGALAAIDPNTGEIIALVGGRDFNKSKFNRATQAYRQPGSAFKPFVYAAAIEQGYRGIDHILDAPLEFSNGWSPTNYSSNKYDGEVTLMTALAKSINTSAVRLAQIDGIERVAGIARRLGITTPYLPDDLSLALGSASLTPLELLVAYSAFANNGYRVKPYSVREVLSRNGDSLEQNGPSMESEISSTTAVEVRSMLQQVTAWGTGTRAKIDGYETFGKTGTTNDYTDAWFVGGVPGLVAVVYVGNDDHKPLGGRSTGSVAALPVWREFVSYAVAKMNLPATFSVPADAEVEAVSVCRKTGFLAAPGCQTVPLLLPQGQAPSATCPWHGGSSLEARSDENAPVLLLAPVDDEISAERYAMRLQPKSKPMSSDGGAPAEAETVPLPQKKPSLNEPVKLPSATADPYKKDPSQMSEMEAKYQQLLKKYKLIE